MEKIVFKVTLTGPVPTTDFLDKEVDKWVKRTKLSASERKKRLKQAIETPEDFDWCGTKGDLRVFWLLSRGFSPTKFTFQP